MHLCTQDMNIENMDIKYKLKIPINENLRFSVLRNPCDLVGISHDLYRACTSGNPWHLVSLSHDLYRACTRGNPWHLVSISHDLYRACTRGNPWHLVSISHDLYRACTRGNPWHLVSISHGLYRACTRGFLYQTLRKSCTSLHVINWSWATETASLINCNLWLVTSA